MIRYLIKILMFAALFMLMPQVIPGISVDRFESALFAALALGLLNILLKPLLVLLTLPFTVLSLGLFIFVINGFLLYLTGILLDGFHVADIWSGIQGALLLTLFGWLLRVIFPSGSATQKRVKRFHIRFSRPGSRPEEERQSHGSYRSADRGASAHRQGTGNQESSSNASNGVIDLEKRGDRWE